jgi:hypothetical protein
MCNSHVGTGTYTVNGSEAHTCSRARMTHSCNNWLVLVVLLCFPRMLEVVAVHLKSPHSRRPLTGSDLVVSAFPNRDVLVALGLSCDV